MGCYPTPCIECKTPTKACQLKNGLCLACRQKKAQQQNTPPNVPDKN